MYTKLTLITILFVFISWGINHTSSTSLRKRLRPKEASIHNDDYEDEYEDEYKEATTQRSILDEDVVEVELKDESATMSPNKPEPFPYYVGNATCTCGKSITKIVGGVNAKIKDLPWTVLLYKIGFFGGKSAFCGGTLINNLYILTASHCVDGLSTKRIEVALNEENKAISTESETRIFKVSKIIMHPMYDRRNVNNDIALLRLATPVELSGNVPILPIVPACIPINNDNNFAGQDAVAAGWGAIRQGGSQSKTLRRVTVPVVTNEECNQASYKGKITENMLCAGQIEGGKDSCQGDSGGPLIIPNGNRATLIGIVSWGYGCAKPKTPGVYSRVGRYAEWIVSNSVDAEWCS